MTLFGDVQHHIYLSTKGAEHDKTPKGDNTDDTWTGHEKVNGMTSKRQRKALQTLQGNVQLVPKTTKGYKDRITPSRDDNSLKYIQRTDPTSKADNNIKAPYGENSRTAHRDSNMTLNRDSDTHITLTGDDQYSVRTPQYRRCTTLNLKGGILKCVTTFRSD